MRLVRAKPPCQKNHKTFFKSVCTPTGTLFKARLQVLALAGQHIVSGCTSPAFNYCASIVLNMFFGDIAASSTWPPNTTIVRDERNRASRVVSNGHEQGRWSSFTSAASHLITARPWHDAWRPIRKTIHVKNCLHACRWTRSTNLRSVHYCAYTSHILTYTHSSHARDHPEISSMGSSLCHRPVEKWPSPLFMCTQH